jgi:O-antigen/teichoic acid export membrane protein
MNNIISFIRNYCKKLVGTSLGKDILLTFSVQLTIMASTFLVNKFLSIKLGVDGYGEYSIIKKTASVLALVMIGGMGIALPRYLSICRIKKDKIEENKLFIASIIIIVLFSMIVFLCISLFQRPFLKFIFNGDIKYHYVLPLLLYSFALCISTYVFSFFRGKGNMLKFNTTQIIVQILLFAGCLFVFMGLTFAFYLWSISIIFFSLFYLVKEFTNIKKKYVKAIKKITISVKQLLRYGIPRMIGDFLLFSFAALPLIAINNKAGIVASGLFSSAVTINSMITPLFSFIGSILLQYTSENLAGENLKPMMIIINKLCLLYMSIAIVAVIMISCLTSFIIIIFYDHSFLDAAPICSIVAWAIIPNAFYLLLRNPLDAISIFPYNTLNLFISFIILVIGMYFASTIKEFSYSYLLSYIVLAILTLVSWLYVKKNNIKTKKI